MKLNKKNKLLIFGFFITLYICYAFAFKNTIKYYDEYNSQKDLAEANINDPLMLQKLVHKEKQLNDFLIRYGGSMNNESFQNELLKQLTNLSIKNNLEIVDFKEPHISFDDKVQTLSYIFSLEGNFNGILLSINSIENNPSLGSVEHISFIKKKDYKKNTDYLVAEVILQRTKSVSTD